MKKWGQAPFFHAALAAAALVLAGCGSDPADLFLVERSGSIPGARLTLLVSDNGTVRCNRGERRDLDSDALLDARELADELREPAERGVVLPPGPGSILRYRARLEDGTVAFSDTSPRQPPEFRRLAALTREIAREVCRLPR